MRTALPPQSIPGPRSLPIIGGKLNFLRFIRDPFTFTRHLYETHGPLVGIGQGDPSYIFVSDPNLNHYLLTNPGLFENSGGPFLRFREGTSLSRLFLNNLAAMNGEHHKQQRRLLQPAFHKKQVQIYHADMIALAEEMLTSWQGRDSIELLSEMKQIAQRVAIKILFGIDDHTKLTEVSTLFRHIVDAVSSPLILLPLELPGTPYYRMLRLCEQVEDYIRNVIANKRNRTNESDVLATLMRIHDENGVQLSDNELIGHAFTLFFGGHATTSHTLTWTLFLLAQHPDVAADLLDELDSVCQGAKPTVEQLDQMPLLDWVIQESMRILPAAPMGLRVATAPCELGGYMIPKGATIFYNQMITHRLPDLYPQPNRFKPDRWSVINPTTYEYLPFGAGIHMCIGMSFAMQEMKVILSLLLQRYRLAVVPGTTINTSLGMRAVPGVPMHLYPQDRLFTRTPVKGKIVSLVEGIG